MTLFLSPALSPEEVVKAKAAGISGVKSYPRGVTTGSEGGVESYERYYPVFEEMQKQDMVLNLHGEVPSNPKEVGPMASGGEKAVFWVVADRHEVERARAPQC